MSAKTRVYSSPSENLADCSKTWLKIGLVSFGGPAAQIGLMHRILVEEKGWLDERQFLNALNFCMLLPGPEAMQLATYAGWRMHGIRGGLVAGSLFVLPGSLVILFLSVLYSLYGSQPLVVAFFLGVKAAVLAIVLEALIRLARRALDGKLGLGVAVLSFVSLFFFQAPYPLVVLAAGAAGFVFIRGGGDYSAQQAGPAGNARTGATLRIAVVFLLMWSLPVLALELADFPPILTELAVFFSKLAVVTFGGAYAVLSYMAQEIVITNGWLTAEEMVDGLGLAETTPGPLILVTQFAGYLAAAKTGGIGLGLLGAFVTLWVTFVPCFLWIFAGAPFIDTISRLPRLSRALSTISAAVVGVILNLSLWFAIHVLFSETHIRDANFASFVVPDLMSLDWRALLIAGIAGMLLFGLRLNIIAVLAASAFCGLVFGLLSI